MSEETRAKPVKRYNRATDDARSAITTRGTLRDARDWITLAARRLPRDHLAEIGKPDGILQALQSSLDNEHD